MVTEINPFLEVVTPTSTLTLTRLVFPSNTTSARGPAAEASVSSTNPSTWPPPSFSSLMTGMVAATAGGVQLFLWPGDGEDTWKPQRSSDSRHLSIDSSPSSAASSSTKARSPGVKVSARNSAPPVRRVMYTTASTSPWAVTFIFSL